jgi:hypothetical protein
MLGVEVTTWYLEMLSPSQLRPALSLLYICWNITKVTSTQILHQDLANGIRGYTN